MSDRWTRDMSSWLLPFFCQKLGRRRISHIWVTSSPLLLYGIVFIIKLLDKGTAPKCPDCIGLLATFSSKVLLVASVLPVSFCTLIVYNRGSDDGHVHVNLFPLPADSFIFRPINLV